MSESWQGWVVGGMVLGALIYLVIRFLNPKVVRGQGVGNAALKLTPKDKKRFRAADNKRCSIEES